MEPRLQLPYEVAVWEGEIFQGLVHFAEAEGEMTYSRNRPWDKRQLYHDFIDFRACESWTIIYLLHQCHCYTFFLLVNMLLIRLVDGTMATLANQGVAQTLRINLSGNNAFVIAHAVPSLWNFVSYRGQRSLGGTMLD